MLPDEPSPAAIFDHTPVYILVFLISNSGLTFWSDFRLFPLPTIPYPDESFKTIDALSQSHFGKLILRAVFYEIGSSLSTHITP